MSELPLRVEGGSYDYTDCKRQFDDALEVWESFEDVIEGVVRELPSEAFRSLILNQVGITDLDKAWRVVVGSSPAQKGGEALRDTLVKSYPLVSDIQVYSVRLELEKEVSKKLGVTGRASIVDQESRGGRDQWSFTLLQNEFFPVAEGSLIDDIANTELWRRILGVSQLGWKDNYPLENTHSRGAHSLHVAINMARVLQGLYEECPDKLVERLRRDFAKWEFYKDSMANEEVALLAAELASTTGMLHDIYTPAGGDMMKHLMSMDEEADAAKLLEGGDERVEELTSVLAARGLTESHVRFIVDCVQGKSVSLVGEMLHSDASDILDQDRLAYTIQDTYSAGVLGAAIPQDLFGTDALANSEDKLMAGWDIISKVLEDSHMHVAGTLMTSKLRPSLSLIDVSDDYILDENLDLVCIRPEKLLWLAAFRTMMSAKFYRGTKLQGQENEIGLALKAARESNDMAKEVLSNANLLRVNNRKLGEQLRALGDLALNDLMASMDRMIFPGRYEGLVIPNDVEVEDAWLAFPLSIKPGLDTRVMDGKEEVSLGEFVGRHPDLQAATILLGVLEEYQDKQRIIEKIA